MKKTGLSIAKSIEKSSPLYEYWQSPQNEIDNKIRLSKVRQQNENKRQAYLYIKAPYKWEILYQSIIRELRKGDLSAIDGLEVLLGGLKEEEGEKALQMLVKEKLISSKIQTQLNQVAKKGSTSLNNLERKKKSDPIRFSKILIAIFINPYGINLKGEKST